MRAKLAVALLAPLIAMSGCGNTKKDAQTYDGPVVPWVSTQPSQLAERAPAATQCRAADLKVPNQVAFEGCGNGGGIGVLARRTAGREAGGLEGTARVRLVKDG